MLTMTSCSLLVQVTRDEKIALEEELKKSQDRCREERTARYLRHRGAKGVPVPETGSHKPRTAEWADRSFRKKDRLRELSASAGILEAFAGPWLQGFAHRSPAVPPPDLLCEPK